MICNFNWNIPNLEKWKDRLAQVPDLNLLQDYDYARSIAPLYGQKPRWAEIEIDGKLAGIMQVMEASTLWKALHAVILDRGPVWFETYGNDEHMRAFAAALSAEFPNRFGRKRRWIIEAEHSDPLARIIQSCGWKRVAGSRYQTSIIDVTQDENTLEQRMRKSWRQSLRKWEKSAGQIIWDQTGQDLALHLKAYALDKAQKGYNGADVKTLHALGRLYGAQGQLLLGKAMHNGQAVAGVMILCHGRGATYQMGWSSSTGRDVCAHHGLLWAAVNPLQQKGVHRFDLGGMNDQGAEAIKRFKTGMGGETKTLLGMYQ